MWVWFFCLVLVAFGVFGGMCMCGFFCCVGWLIDLVLFVWGGVFCNLFQI